MKNLPQVAVDSVTFLFLTNREELVREKEEAQCAIKDFQKKHEEENEQIKMKTAAEKDVRLSSCCCVVFHCWTLLQELREKLESTHQQELLSVQQANHLAVSVLREEMEQQKLRELEWNLQEHCAQMGMLCHKKLCLQGNSQTFSENKVCSPNIG